MDEEKKTMNAETIRNWYHRNTKKAIRSIIGATVVLLSVAVMMWILAPLETLARLQTFNGALIIPGAGGLWIASFMYVWLIPMREISFRGQESLERMESRFVQAFEDKFNPAVETWQRIGTEVETKILPDVKRAVTEANKAVSDAQKSLKEIEGRMEKLEMEAGPTLDMLQRVGKEIEKEVKLGLFTQMRSALQSLEQMNGLPSAPPPPIDDGLTSIRKRIGQGAVPPIAKADERRSS